MRCPPRARPPRVAELEKALPRIALDGAGRDAVDALTRAIVNKILHAPLARLREELEGEAGLAHLEAARSLFALEEAEASDPGPDAEASDEEPDAGR